ncbi:hypothetical protein GCM10007972_15720 [Iodidimonas muriae]|uniref:DNA primase n=1 Tax=Iodidimonas muriae TaxID=261467 RepID=A0ABQ2LF50_9PROT|nr:hypothetical protein [Iodidimonas muriae]GER07969.1 hypothetical protein JCM17843_22790 [Kordiimonadales bacterium JCM 17843]GGO11709.1 hypothetical protein GCM10007972_15720 [Iodidimonas muriae]
MTTDRFQTVSQFVQPLLFSLISRLLPSGRREGRYWVALNPTRADRKRGSFKVNLMTGAWRDYATGDGGGDVISLYAYVYGLKQSQALGLIEQQAGISNDR